MNLLTKIGRFDKETEAIDKEIETLYNKIHELNDKRLELLEKWLDINGKFIKFKDNVYISVKSISVNYAYGGSGEDYIITIFGSMITWVDSPYFDERSFMYKCGDTIDLSESDLKHIKEITKEEYLQAFDKLISKIKKSELHPDLKKKYKNNTI